MYNQNNKAEGGTAMERKTMLGIYSAAHFWVDLSCAFLVFRTLMDAETLPLCLLLYNFCAFALQMPLGLLADKFDRNGLVAALGCILVALAYLSPLPLLTAVVAGCGNALFHLGGGIDVLNTSQAKAWALGIFVSPGALGLFLGTLWGNGLTVPLWLAPAGLLLMTAVILLPYRNFFGSLRSGNAPCDTTPVNGFAPLLPLFLVVVLRSYMGMNQTFDWKSTGHWAVILTVALVLGKAAGGILMDRWGPRKTSAITLTGAAVLYIFCDMPILGTLAVFLFNMTMPITLWAAAKVTPGCKGFAFGLLTFGLFVGYLPGWMGLPSILTSPAAYALVALVSLALLWFPLGRDEMQC